VAFGVDPLPAYAVPQPRPIGLILPATALGVTVILRGLAAPLTRTRSVTGSLAGGTRGRSLSEEGDGGLVDPGFGSRPLETFGGGAQAVAPTAFGEGLPGGAGRRRHPSPTLALALTLTLTLTSTLALGLLRFALVRLLPLLALLTLGRLRGLLSLLALGGL